MDLVDRLRVFINGSGYSSTQFADQAQISRATLSQILSGRNKKISNEIIAKLHEAFPSLDVMWLLFGEGDYEPIILTNPPENLLDSNETPDVSEDAILRDLNKNKSDDKNVEDKKISDEEILSFATDFFPSDKPDKSTMNVQRNPSGNISNKPRRIVAITVFYSDNTYETLSVPEKK